MAVVSLRLCADKPGPSLAANAFRTDISCRFCTKTMHYLVFILCTGVFDIITSMGICVWTR